MAATTFFIPISNGIICPQHRKKIGSAIWLFLLLVDWTTKEEDGVGCVRGGKPIKVREMMAALDLQERQVRDQLQRLNGGKYIQLKRTPYGYSISVLKSKKWANRDRQKTAALSDSERQKTAGLKVETGNFPPDRPAENRRCNKDITLDYKNKNAHRKNRDAATFVSTDKKLVLLFAAKYLAQVGSAYPIFWGRDRKLFKSILSAGHTEAEIAPNMNRYFDDPYYRQIGFDIPGFVKAYPKLNSAGAKPRHNYEDGAFPQL